MLQNPIFKGFNPDPAICRKGDDYYVAVSTFEWFPGIPIYHSKDMKHWELLTHVLTDDTNPNLTKLPSAKGIWAPCLTYCEEEDMFYVIYGVMNSMNARYFDVNNYLISTAMDGNENSIERLLAFYDPYITKCCLRPLYDEYGNVYIVVDMELKGLIREALIKMILDFEIDLEIDEE